MASKKLLSVNLAELQKRCPVNQMKQFFQFLEKNADYKRRVNKYPEKLPRVDWDYYRANVRPEYVKMVNEFEQKYKDLNATFDKRAELDTSKYYVELEKERAEVKKMVEEFIASSNQRIAHYEGEIKRVNAMMPYSSMTMEDYIDVCPPYQHPLRTPDGGPTFWPHSPEEQVGAERLSVNGGAAAEPGGQAPPQAPPSAPPKAPPAAPPSAAPAGKAADAPPAVPKKEAAPSKSPPAAAVQAPQAAAAPKPAPADAAKPPPAAPPKGAPPAAASKAPTDAPKKATPGKSAPPAKPTKR